MCCVGILPACFGGCASYVAGEVGRIVVDMVFYGFTADLGHTIIDVIGCAGNIGNVFDKVTLSWDNLSDVDLHVIDPNGERIYNYHKNSRSGGILDFDNRYGYGPENIYWLAGEPCLWALKSASGASFTLFFFTMSHVN